MGVRAVRLGRLDGLDVVASGGSPLHVRWPVIPGGSLDGQPRKRLDALRVEDGELREIIDERIDSYEAIEPTLFRGSDEG